ncbi:MAG TPA: glycosyltransferase family 2 protein [Thermoanaerobaculales bacterium]|nr:glycosyltransferase family 2 protein [Thermoanaerobaculales bacterium]HQN96914.1 glycosyltransferase family 2 protein [Thermoanaerobaculales bacterium]
MTARRTAAVVVRWRGGDEVDRCLRSLLEHGGRDLERVVLVDSGSADGGAERLAAAFPAVEVVALEENRSFGHAANQGAARTDSPFLLLLNPDAAITAGAIDALTDELARRPDAAGVVPLLIGADGAPQHRWQLRRLPGLGRLAAGRGGAPMFPGRAPAEPAPVEQPAAAAWLVRRPVWDALGGLDEGFAPAWWEDVDFCARLRELAAQGRAPAAGFRVVPSARVVHGGGSSLAHLTDADFLRAYHRNLLRYAERHHPGSLGLVRAGLQLGLALRAVTRPSRRSAYRAAMRVIRER